MPHYVPQMNHTQTTEMSRKFSFMAPLMPVAISTIPSIALAPSRDSLTSWHWFLLQILLLIPLLIAVAMRFMCSSDIDDGDDDNDEDDDDVASAAAVDFAVDGQSHCQHGDPLTEIANTLNTSERL